VKKIFCYLILFLFLSLPCLSNEIISTINSENLYLTDFNRLYNAQKRRFQKEFNLNLYGELDPKVISKRKEFLLKAKIEGVDIKDEGTNQLLAQTPDDLKQRHKENLILEKYDLNENRVTLYFKYLLSKNLHTLIVEARSHFGTISGNYDINPKTFGIEYKIDDNVELIISYVPLKNDNNISSVKINIAQEQRSDITPDMKDKLVTFFGKFGDKPISLDQIRTKLYNNIVKFNDDTILVNAIIKNPRNKLNK